MKTFYVQKTRIANELLKRGYVILEVLPNDKQPQKTVFGFKYESNIVDDYREIRELTWEK